MECCEAACDSPWLRILRRWRSEQRLPYRGPHGLRQLFVRHAAAERGGLTELHAACGAPRARGEVALDAGTGCAVDVRRGELAHLPGEVRARRRDRARRIEEDGEVLAELRPPAVQATLQTCQLDPQHLCGLFSVELLDVAEHHGFPERLG